MVQTRQFSVATGLAIVVLATIQKTEQQLDGVAQWLNEKSIIAEKLFGADETRKEAAKEVVLAATPFALYALAAVVFLVVK